MTETENKLLALGRMVFNMITDIAILPPSDTGYGRRTVTYPDGKGGKSSVELIVARREAADIMEYAVRSTLSTTPIPSSSGKAQ